MSYSIQELECPGCWQVVYTGEINAEVRHRALLEGLAMTAGRPLKGILIDFSRATMDMSLTEMYRLGENKVLGQRFLGVRTAFLVTPETTDNEFLALVMNNRGLLTKVFLDRSSALAWLDKGL